MYFLRLLTAVLLYDTVLASATCSHTLSSPGDFHANSRELLDLGLQRCEFFLRAPANYVIVLNFTEIYGFDSAVNEPLPESPSESSTCMPSLEIANVEERDGSVHAIACICRDTRMSRVFSSSSSVVKMTFVWRALSPSGFSLHYDFHLRDSNASGVVSSTIDGRNFNKTLPTFAPKWESPHSQSKGISIGPTHSNACAVGTVSNIQIIIVVIAIVLTLGFVTCIISHYKMGARSWSERWNRQSQHPQQTHHHHGDLNASRVLCVSTPNPERLEREKASFQDRQTRIKSVQLDFELDLPPSIALPDGEEQPYGSLQHLHLRNAEQESEIYRKCIHAPPNKTIFEGESPPPYRSSSVGVLHPQANSTPPSRVMRDWNATPQVKRCKNANNSSRNGNHSNSSSCSHSPQLPQIHQQHYHHVPLPNTMLRPEIRQPACPPEGEPPPGYSEVLANPNIYSSLDPNGGV